ncbi:MAG: FAD-dependent oxidoreductase [Bacteroidota bacterium]
MITILGGGAIGLCSAYFLHKAGYEVQVIEQSSLDDTSGCSYGNAGMIVPSHFVPLAAPGVIGQGLKWLLDSKSPFYIKPRLDRHLINWLWLFLKSANNKNIRQVGDQLFQLNHASKELYDRIIDEGEFSVHHSQHGLMMLYQTESTQVEEEHVADQARRLGIEVDNLNADEVQALETDFQMNVRGGVHYFSDAHLDPGMFMGALKNYLIKSGVDIHMNTSFQAFLATGKKLTHVLTNKGPFESEKVIIAAGTWSQELARRLKLHIPLQGGKGYSLTVKNSPLQLKIPSILCEKKIAMTPMGNNLRIAGTMEIAGTNRNVSANRLQGIKEGVSEYLTNFNPKSMENIKPWVGLRPVSPDGIPYIGKSEKWDNLYINTGHAMMGMSLAPVSGQILTDIILNKSVKFNLHILSPDRF